MLQLGDAVSKLATLVGDAERFLLLYIFKNIIQWSLLITERT